MSNSSASIYCTHCFLLVVFEKNKGLLGTAKDVRMVWTAIEFEKLVQTSISMKKSFTFCPMVLGFN